MDKPPPSATVRVRVRDTPDRSGRAHRSAPPASAPASVFVCAWLLAAAAAAVFLAAGPAQGSLGIFLAAAGAVLTFVPARVRVGWPLWAAAGGLLFCGSLSFLPARWFALPQWRAVLGAEPAIHLPPTVTPVPWETGFWLGVLGASCLLGLYLLSHPLRSQAALGIVAAAVAVCGIYAGLSIYARQTGWHYPFAGDASFGFFPNRNHTASFLVTGSIAALGVLTIGLRENRWVLCTLVGACLAACVAGLFFFSGSRGGIIFLGVGTLLWAGGLGGAHRSVPLNVSLAVLALAAGLLFLLSGGEARSRLLGEHAGSATVAATAGSGRPDDPADASPPSQGDATFGFRTLIYRDTLDLIKDAPLTGTGLGAFAPTFAEYRRASLSHDTVIHPESDWLMLVAEAGVPAIFFALAGVGLLLARLRGAHLHPYWPLRWACVSAALAAALHGIVDVPAHRVALGWWILLLAGLGAQAGGSRNARSCWPQRMLFVAGGVAALVLGTQLIRAEWFGGRALPPFAAAAAMKDILATTKRGDQWAAMEKARAAAEVSPLDGLLYYRFGSLALHFEDSDREVDEAFHAQRLLNPTSPSAPVLQGYAWAALDPKRATALWRDALDRQTRLGPIYGGPVALYRAILNTLQEWPSLQRDLAPEVERGPGFLLAWLGSVPAAVAREQWPGLLARHALLERLTPEQRGEFLLLWYAKGDRGELARFLAENATWQEWAWPIRLRGWIDAGQYEPAVRAEAERVQVSLALPSQAAPATDQEPDDRRIAGFNAAWSAGSTASARLILDEAGDPPAEVPAALEYWRLKASLAVYDQEWPQAWECLKRYVHLARPAEILP